MSWEDWTLLFDLFSLRPWTGELLVKDLFSGSKEVIVSLRKLQKISYFSIGEMTESRRLEREGKTSEKVEKRSFRLILEV